MLKYADPGEITGQVAPTRATNDTVLVHRVRYEATRNARTEVLIYACFETRTDGAVRSTIRGQPFFVAAYIYRHCCENEGKIIIESILKKKKNATKIINLTLKTFVTKL